MGQGGGCGRVSEVWDIDFLSSKQNVDQALVYLYRPASGILILHMRNALKAAAEQQGYQLEMCTNKEARAAVVGATSLFGISYAIWHVEPGRKIDSETATRVLGIMAAGRARRFALFLPEKSALTRRALWPQVEKACLVVRETSITPENLRSALRYLERTTTLATDLQLSSQQEFIDSFSELLQQDEPEMVDLLRQFNERVVIYTDLKHKRFNGESFRRDTAEVRRLSSLDRALRDFIGSRSDLDMTDFIASVDWFYWTRSWDPGNLLNHLYRLSCRELRNVRQHKANWNPRRGRHAVAQVLGDYEMAERYILWSAIVLAWESRLIEVSSDVTFGLRRSSDLSMTKLHQIALEFSTRSSRTTQKDRLKGLWSSLDITLSRIALPELVLYDSDRERPGHLSDGDFMIRLREWRDVSVTRYKLVSALVETMELLPSAKLSTLWLSRLQHSLTQTQKRMTELIQDEDRKELSMSDNDCAERSV